MPETDNLATSLRVNPELWKAAKVYAIQHDMSLKELVETALTKTIYPVQTEGSAKQ